MSDFDGSSWAVGSSLPGPEEVQWDDHEVFHRRPTFTNGRWIIGSDGLCWCLPALDRRLWERSKSLREYIDRAADQDLPPPGLVETTKLFRLLFTQMIALNYDLAGERMVRIFTVETPDGRDFDDLPILAMARYLDEHARLLLAFRDSEATGMTVEDILALDMLTGLPGTFLGWNDHDGIIFDN